MAAISNQPQLLFSQLQQAGARPQGVPQVQGLQLIQANGGNGLGPQQMVTINGTPQQLFTTGQPLHVRQAAPGVGLNHVVRPLLTTTSTAATPAPQQQRIIPIQLGGGATRIIQLPSGQPGQQVVINRLGPGTTGPLAATQMQGQNVSANIVQQPLIPGTAVTMRPAGQMMPTLVHPNNNAATLAAPAGLALNGALKINPRQNTVTTYNPTTGMRTTNGTGPGILQQAVLPNGGINGGATTTTRTVILPNGNPVTLVQQQAPTNQQNQQQAANLLQLRQQQALSELRARMAVVAAQQQQQAGVQRVTTANGQVLNVRLINADGTPVATSNGQQVLDLSQLLNQARPDALQQAKKAAAAQQQLLQQQQQQQPQQQQVLRIGNQQVVLLPNTRLGAGHNNMAAVHLLQQQQQLGEQQAQRTAQFARQLSNPVMANNTIDRPGAAHPDFLLANGSMEGVPMQLGSKSLSLSAELARVAPDHNMQHHAFSTLTSPGTPAPLASPTGLSDHNGSLANTDLSIKGALGLNGSAVTGNGGPEDLRVILSSIGQELARHGISVDAAVGAGWLGALSPGDVALLREVHATETRRLLMQPQAALNSAQLSPSADSNATDAALLSSGGTVSSNNSDGTSTLRSNGTGPGQEGTGHTMNGPSGATAHDPAGLDLSIDEMMAMMGAGGQGDAPFSAFSYGFFADVLDSSDGPPGGRLLEPLEPAATENGNAAAGGHALGDLVYRSFDAKSVASSEQDGAASSAASAASAPAAASSTATSAPAPSSNGNHELAARFAHLDLGCGFF